MLFYLYFKLTKHNHKEHIEVGKCGNTEQGEERKFKDENLMSYTRNIQKIYNYLNNKWED